MNTIKVVAVVAACITGAAFSQQTQMGMGRVGPFRSNAALDKALADPARHPLQIKRRAKIWQDGGFVQAPTTGKVVRIVNAQSTIPLADIKAIGESVQQVLRVPISIVAVKSGKSPDPDPQVGAEVKLVEKDGEPRILIAPEDCRAQVNIQALRADGATAEVVKVRTMKEFWRSLAYMLGAANTQMQPCLMHNVFSLADLDSNNMQVPSPEPFKKMAMTVRELGFVPAKMVLYRKAVQEGWAPEPATDIQRKIKDNPKVEIDLPADLRQALDTVLRIEKEQKERGPTNPILIPPPNGRK